VKLSAAKWRRGVGRRSIALYFEAAMLVAISPPIRTLAQTPSSRDLTGISLEDLMNLQVTSASKKGQSLSKVASSIYVIDSEDIRRSSANNIPDLLRMAPGVDVAQINAHSWAISIRGFNERFTRSVLVLIDGRTVYSPLSGGVNWDQQDVPLEDIERIEVIRGPGGTVWGANAMNGVINIITKSALATKGGLVRASGGSQQSASALTQYGGSAGPTGAYRIFGDYMNEGHSPGYGGKVGEDGWHTLHGGFRADLTLSSRDTITVQGDISEVSARQTVESPISTEVPAPEIHDDPATVAAGNVLTRWNRTLSDHSAFSLQVYYDRYNRLDTGLREIRDTIDVDFQHRLTVASRSDIVWGLGYRNTRDDLNNDAVGNTIAYNPPRRADSLFSTFVQDQIRLTGNLSLTVGSKFEHNGYTGFEFEPSVQLAWQPTLRQEVWISASRAIRQPTRTDVGVFVESPFVLPNGQPGLITLSGNPDESAARLLDVEIGYRAQISKRLSVDVATFLGSYAGLLTVEPGIPYYSSEAARLVIPEEFANLSHASSYGAEIAANWNVTSRWRISPGYSLLHIDVGLDPSSYDVQTVSAPKDSAPEQQFQVRSQLNLMRNTELDSSLFYVSSLRGVFPTPAYTRFDTRIARRFGEFVEVSIVGQNLLTARHAEFADTDGLVHTLVSRSVFGKVTWRF
jgi:iron complex outermembrane receptor protein